ncbi:complement receptor type 2-like isoform X2 [Lineus longissimus]|uniref:complement receptor type 2-like isoform X2 n=1 Tax=Lineus longissimus TaxID=88925 RepID=UPI00315D41EA
MDQKLLNHLRVKEFLLAVAMMASLLISHTSSKRYNFGDCPEMSSAVVNIANTESVTLKTGQTKWGHTRLNFSCQDYYRHFDGVDMQIYYCDKAKGFFPYWYEEIPICKEGACISPKKGSGQWMRLGDACYQKMNNGTFQEAKTQCTGVGGHVVDPMTTPLPNFPRQIYQVLWNITEAAIDVGPFWLDAEKKSGKWLTSDGTEIKNVCFDSVIKAGGAGNCLTAAMTKVQRTDSGCNVMIHDCAYQAFVICQHEEIGCPRDWPGGDRLLAQNGSTYTPKNCGAGKELFPKSATCQGGSWGLIPKCKKVKGCGKVHRYFRGPFKHKAKLNFKRICKKTRIMIPGMPALLTCMYGDFYYDTKSGGKVIKNKMTTAEVIGKMNRDGHRQGPCQVLKCKTPKHWKKIGFVVGGRPIADAYRVNLRINIICPPSYKTSKYLKKLNGQLRCLKTGRWNANVSSDATLCDRITCTKPYPAMPNNKRYLYSEGTKEMTVECANHHGTMARDGTWSTKVIIQCDLKTEQWVPPAEKCEAFKCTKPNKDIGRATVSGNTSSIRVSCKQEFEYADGKTLKDYICDLKKNNVGLYEYEKDRKDDKICGTMVKECRKLPVVENAVFKRSWLDVSYTCRNGYIFPDKKTTKNLKCAAKTGWPPIGNCAEILCTEQPANISNGNLTHWDKHQATYKCEKGYKFDTEDDGVINCTANGWPAIKCIIITTTTVPPTIVKSRGGGPGNGNGGTGGGGGDKGGGGGGGGRTIKLVQCVDVVQSHDHLKLINKGDFFTGYSAVYMCTDGFVFDNDQDYAMATCTDKGKMVPSTLPICVKKGCDLPQYIKHANKSLARTTVKHVMVYTCLKGYEFPNGNNIMYTTCSAKGTWVPTLPHCQLKTTCPSPPDAENATKTSREDHEPVGRINVYSCHAGHRFPNAIKNEYIWCTSRGRWNRRVVHACNLVHCGQLNVPSNASCEITRQELTGQGDDLVGTELKCRCYWDGARFRDGDLFKTPLCRSSGRWSMDLPPCGDAEWCYYPPQLHKAVLIDSKDQKRNSTVRYMCEKGYHWPNNMTNMTAYCNMSGFWTYPFKVCYPNPCEPIEDTLDALRLHSLNYSYSYYTHVPVPSQSNFTAFYRDELIVSCPDNTTEFPTGEVERQVTCSHDGTWKPKIPLCAKKLVSVKIRRHVHRPEMGPMPPIPMIALVFLAVVVGIIGLFLVLDVPKVLRDLFITGGRNRF